ncbi:MAG TPA: L-cystine-binding protein TcyK [Firmicutes bacterium]|nr:L-cystine-binding protein TcyK [Bacillota bacterium]
MKKLDFSKIVSLFLMVAALMVATNFSTVSCAPAPKKIIIGTGNAFKPYCYLDEDGKPVGYEYEVLTAVNKRLPQYRFEFQTLDFQNILLSLQSKKIDIAAHQYEKNPEREQKYRFGKESYTTFILRIVVSKKRNDINSIKDLDGKTVQVSPGANEAYVMEQYNKSHGNKVKLVYADSGANPALAVQNIENGRIDAFISIKRIMESYNKAYGDKLKTVGDPIASSSTYDIFRKEDAQLQEDVDTALRSLKADGTLAKISIKVLGGDYTTSD